MIKLFHCITVIFLLGATLVSAEQETALEETVEYTSPGDLSDEQWVQFREKIAIYNNCLRQEMVIKVKNGSDARLVSNQVLEACRFHLLDLQQEMLAKNLDPNFVDRYIYTNKNKAGRKMLGAIMILMSQHQQAAEAAEQQDSTEKEANP